MTQGQRCRVIQGLKWVRLAERPPFPQPRSRKGTKALGLAYERKLKAELLRQFPATVHGLWMEFEDSGGHGFAQPDFLVLREDQIIILEAKLSWTPEAYRQLAGLYQPLVERYFTRPAKPLVVCKYLRPEYLPEPLIPTILWLGVGPLVLP